MHVCLHAYELPIHIHKTIGKLLNRNQIAHDDQSSVRGLIESNARPTFAKSRSPLYHLRSLVPHLLLMLCSSRLLLLAPGDDTTYRKLRPPRSVVSLCVSVTVIHEIFFFLPFAFFY